MFLRWKEAKYSQISGYQFFKRLSEKSLGYSISKNSRINGCFFSNPMKLCLLGYFFHAEFIIALKTKPKSMVFEKYAKNGKKNIYYHYFLFFEIFV